MSKLTRLRYTLSELQVDGLLITNPYNRRYISGFTGSAGVLLITMKEAMLITDFRYIEQASSEAKEFKIIKHEKQAIDEIKKQIQSMNLNRLGFESENMTYAQFESYKTSLPVELVPTKGLVEALRLIKSEDEQSILRYAAKIADKAFEHILNYIKPGVRELDIANELEYFMRKEGASSSSFEIIVASGIRSSLPHGAASNKKISHGELVTLDFGALYNGYCSDITRTVAVGKISDQLKEIYDVVLTAQRIGVEGIKPGMKASEADALTRNYITEQGYGNYFGHSTGHGIGLEIHEGPALSPRSDVALEEGMVVTVEPGIYLPNIGGCRIEDDVVITENGNERLTLATKELIQL